MIIHFSQTQTIKTFYVWQTKKNYAIIYGGAFKYIYFFNETKFNQGDVFHANYTINDLIEPLNKSSMNFKNYLFSQNIFHSISLQNIKLKENVTLINGYINKYLNQIENMNAAEFFGTILFNIHQKNELVEITKKLGLLHLIIISGFHVHLLIILVKQILRKWKGTFLIDFFIPIILSLCITVIFNFSVSTIRVTLFIIATYIFRNEKNHHLRVDKTIAFAGLIHFIFFPAVVVSPTFLLSYGVTYYLMLISFNKLWRQKGLLTLIKKYIFFILIANIIAFPLLVHINYEYNLLSAFMQILLTPLIISLFPILTLCLFIEKLHFLVGEFYKIIINFLEIIDVGSIRMVFGAITPSLLFIILFSINELIWGLIRKKYKWSAAISFHLVLLWVIIYHKNYLDSFYHIEFINVGSGLSILIRLPFNKGNILLDAPSNNNIDKYELVPYLKYYGIKKLDFIFLSHDDWDHKGGEKLLIKQFQVKNVYDHTSRFYQVRLHNLQITNLNRHYKELWSDNNKSLVLDVKYKNIKLLFTGDIEKEAEKIFCNRKDDFTIIQIPHHGSWTSSSKCFMNSFQTKYAVSSNSHKYGFPREEVVQRYKNKGAIVYSTLWNGQISFAFSNIISYIFKNGTFSFL